MRIDIWRKINWNNGFYCYLFCNLGWLISQFKIEATFESPAKLSVVNTSNALSLMYSKLCTKYNTHCTIRCNYTPRWRLGALTNNYSLITITRLFLAIFKKLVHTKVIWVFFLIIAFVHKIVYLHLAVCDRFLLFLHPVVIYKHPDTSVCSGLHDSPLLLRVSKQECLLQGVKRFELLLIFFALSFNI